MKTPAKLLSGALNRYRPVEAIKEGGMAEVYRASAIAESGLERTVALKKILPEFAADDMFVAMFLDEARIASRLDHPNIVKTLDFGRWDDGYFIAMEYVSGCDLRTIVERCSETGSSFPIRHACRIVEEVADALSYVHNRQEDGASMQIVHRDVSPDNVMISDNGEVKLTDFGVAKAADRRAWTFVGSVKGKAPYLAPERIDGQGDHRSDIFAAGVLLWELLTNERLFQGDSDWEIIARIESDAVPPPSSRNSAVPPGLDAIVAQALKLRPGERYQNASDLRDALRRFCSTSGERSSERALAAWTRRVLHERFAGHAATRVARNPRTPTPRVRTTSSPRMPAPRVRTSSKERRPRQLPDADAVREQTTRRAPRVNVNVIRRFAEGTPAWPIQAIELDVDTDYLDSVDDVQECDFDADTTHVHPSRRVRTGVKNLASWWSSISRGDAE